MKSRAALVLTDAVAVCAVARCFSGPGELTAALGTLAVVHLACHLAGRYPQWRRALLLAGVLAAAIVPVLIVLGPSPAADLHNLSTDMPGAWRVLMRDVAPVPELPGLVLLAAWAAGVLALCAEALSARRLPAIVALLPALALYLFAASVGAGSWRVLELGALAGSACCYLVLAVHERSACSVLVATDTADVRGRRATSKGPARRAVWKVSALAAVAAAVIGPNLPGARSAALVPIRGVTTSPRGAGTGNGTGGGQQPTTGVEVSTLVDVGEQEIDNPGVALFTVYSSLPTREVIAVLDDFDGSSWHAVPGPPEELRRVSVPLATDEGSPPQPVSDGPGHDRLVQVFRIAALGGKSLPDWGVAAGVDVAGEALRLGASGPIVSESGLTAGSTYAVVSETADPSAAALSRAVVDGSDRIDLRLPGPVPAELVQLAHRIVAGATGPYGEALAIEDYLNSSRFFYRLPATAGQTAPAGRGYAALESFLFDSRTGYCQQFATAFAVLARIDGLPTRLAVGFLPGRSVGHDRWLVEGSDTHAWPQVLFSGYGWIDFEPTPGVPGTSATTPSGTTGTTTPVGTTTGVGGSHNPTGGRGGRTGGTVPPGSSTAGRAVPWVLWLLPPLGGLLAWVVALSALRRVRRRRLLRRPAPAVLAAWRESARTLARLGVVRRSSETYQEMARRAVAAGALSPGAEQALGDLTRLLGAVCYGAQAPAAAVASRALGDAAAVTRGAASPFAGPRRLAAALDPRTLVV